MMKQLFLSTALIAMYACSLGQAPQPIYKKVNPVTRSLKQEADSLYNIKQYELAAHRFDSIIQMEEGKLPFGYYLEAASCYSLAGQLDSAAKRLTEIAGRGYVGYAYLIGYFDLTPVHAHASWNSICSTVNANRMRKIKNPNREVILSLDTVTVRDQKRMELHFTEEKYGKKSPQYDSLKKEIIKDDSLNFSIVSRILDQYGWLSPDEIGSEGGTALFIVLLHASPANQEKYYSQVKVAVDKKYIPPFLLCYMNDRISVNQGEPQTYGTQVGVYKGTETYFVYPIKDVENIDARRSSLGLGSMTEYLKDYKIEWSVEYYKKELTKVKREIKSESSRK